MASAGVVCAQSKDELTTGLLGETYAEANVTAIDAHDSPHVGRAVGARFSMPIVPRLDVAASFNDVRRGEVTMLSAFELKDSSRDANVEVTRWFGASAFKPFVRGGLGYEWTKRDIYYGGAPILNAKDNGAMWRLGVGAEIAAGAVAVTPTIGYRDGFEREAQALTYAVEANYWAGRHLGVFAGVAFDDPRPPAVSLTTATGGTATLGGTTAATAGSLAVVNRGGAAESWRCTMGARYRF